MSLFQINTELEGYPALKRSNFSEYEDKYDVFSDLHDSTNWFRIQEDGWHLPGTETKKEDCGRWLTKGCLDVANHVHGDYKGKIYIKTFQKSCYRADCELCFKKWMARQSGKAEKRIKKYENLSKKKVKHIIVSPPAWLHNKPKKELAKLAYKVLKDVNCIGGAVVFHPFRYNRDYKEWYYSPHFHVLGFGWIENTVGNYNKNGWFVKNKGTRDSIFSTVYYQLSHAGIKKHNHTLVWFGDLSYSKLKVEDEPEKDQCPLCNGDLKLIEHYGLWGFVPPPEIEGEFYEDPDGWQYVVNDNSGFKKFSSIKNPRTNYVNDGQGIGTDYQRWVDKKESVKIAKSFVSSSSLVEGGTNEGRAIENCEGREDSSS